ncbi:hypothetical protein BEH94_03310 [Candidatus Altiarchaeales archaeon WOR_SM1_SCG]|nr:hypothetical protein BEH94_03310 [Candidatus Altiarchaeales archaeon WOR_SM1_SCG]
MTKELFNPKTVKRLCSKTEVTDSQEKAAEEWLKLLDEDKLKIEKQGYIPFATTILRDLLGYDIGLDSLKHEDKHMEFSFEDKTGNKFVCFEAKGTDTKDLWAYQHRATKTRETPVNQINDYIYKYRIPYGVLTNYRIFVLFDRDKGYEKYHKFDFSDIRDNDEKLREFIAIFSRKNIEGGFIEKLEKESAIEEREFTKEFYKLFHETRLMLIHAFQENGATRDEAIHYSQLFLNRLMFIFFAEDTGKLKERIFEDSVISVLKTELLISDQSRMVSDVIAGLFRRLDKGSETPYKIFGFNGGLFEEDIPPHIFFKDLRDKEFFKEVYQNSKLKKELKLDNASKLIFSKYQNNLNPVIKNLIILASFDFKTEVSVNILGHVFEQSLSDLEELKEGEISKRKKEGVFYTPEYITDYICRNTIIPFKRFRINFRVVNQRIPAFNIPR